MNPIGNESKKHFSLSEAIEALPGRFVRKRLFQTDSMHFNLYCIGIGAQNPLHRHPISDEVLYFVSGTGECVVGKETYRVKSGDVVLVPKDAAHSIRNTSDRESLICVLAQAPLPCEHVPVGPG